jgi:NADH-ubiquinone oxidoreductase chain 1
MRGVAQTISYEIGLAIILLRFLVRAKGHGLVAWIRGPFSYRMATLMAPLITVWVVSCVAETNRTPFDFAEGESELVSGFNIEYGAGGFALIFIAEYARILFLRLVTAAIFLRGERLRAETAFARIALAYG